jgi:hypothetical protein
MQRSYRVLISGELADLDPGEERELCAVHRHRTRAAAAAAVFNPVGVNVDRALVRLRRDVAQACVR